MRTKQSKIILNLMLMSFLISLLPVSCVQAGSATGAYGIAVIDGKNADKVHLRAFASQDSESLGLYFTGTQVLCESDPIAEWTFVRIGTRFGYIKSEYLSFDIATAVSKQPVGHIANASGSTVKICADPTVEAAISGIAKVGDVVIVQGETNTHWYYVLVNGLYGYVKKTAVNLEKNHTLPDPTMDSSLSSGEYLGKNTVQNASENSVYIICRQIPMYKSPSDSSEVLRWLFYGDELEGLKIVDNWLEVKDSFMEGDDVKYVTGWIKKGYTAINSPIYIAMHPTPVFTAPRADALILSNMNTYDSLRIIYELDEYYCVSIERAVGFVVKE